MTSNTSWYNVLEFSGYPSASFNLGPASDADLATRAKDGDGEAGAELERRKRLRADASRQLVPDPVPGWRDAIG